MYYTLCNNVYLVLPKQIIFLIPYNYMSTTIFDCLVSRILKCHELSRGVLSRGVLSRGVKSLTQAHLAALIF